MEKHIIKLSDFINELRVYTGNEFYIDLNQIIAIKRSWSNPKDLKPDTYTIHFYTKEGSVVEYSIAENPHPDFIPEINRGVNSLVYHWSLQE